MILTRRRENVSSPHNRQLPKQSNIMKTKSHTPGPWTYIYSGVGLDLKGNNGNYLIAEFPCLAKEDGTAYHPSEEDSANLRLIQAAPDLLEALQQLVSLIDDKEGTGDMHQARSAINKAIGNA